LQLPASSMPDRRFRHHVPLRDGVFDLVAVTFGMYFTCYSLPKADLPQITRLLTIIRLGEADSHLGCCQEGELSPSQSRGFLLIFMVVHTLLTLHHSDAEPVDDMTIEKIQHFHPSPQVGSSNSSRPCSLISQSCLVRNKFFYPDNDTGSSPAVDYNMSPASEMPYVWLPRNTRVGIEEVPFFVFVLISISFYLPPCSSIFSTRREGKKAYACIEITIDSLIFLDLRKTYQKTEQTCSTSW
jgi:hypothetical protein